MYRQRPQRRQAQRQAQAENEGAAGARVAAVATEQHQQGEQAGSEQQSGEPGGKEGERAADPGEQAACQGALGHLRETAQGERDCRHQRQQGLGLMRMQDQPQRTHGQQGSGRACGATVQGLCRSGGKIHAEGDEDRTGQARTFMQRQKAAADPGQERARPVVERWIGGQWLASEHRKQPALTLEHAQDGTQVHRIVAAPGVVPGEADEQIEAHQQRDADGAVDATQQQGGVSGSRVMRALWRGVLRQAKAGGKRRAQQPRKSG